VKILITGVAGFIGSHLALRLLKQNDNIIIGVDNLNHYYDVNLKKARLKLFQENSNFSFIQFDISNRQNMKDLFSKYQFDIVVNLAAQAGVRYSLKNPQAYIDANIVGFCNILEGSRHSKIKHLVFASSSSVYGANTHYPFSEHDNVDHPIALYAATKKANELMAHSYASLYKLPCTGLRFFTVYGPWGRPDMALFKFTKNIIENNPIDIYNNGDMVRDFTYIDDNIEGIMRVINHPAQPNDKWSGENPDPATSYAPYRIYTIGNNNPVKLMDFIEAIEKTTGKKAIKNFLPIQAGDVSKTYADVSALENKFGFKPKTSIQEGINKFIEWYLSYYAQ